MLSYKIMLSLQRYKNVLKNSHEMFEQENVVPSSYGEIVKGKW